jgi:hypothetical protein
MSRPSSRSNGPDPPLYSSSSSAVCHIKVTVQKKAMFFQSGIEDISDLPVIRTICPPSTGSDRELIHIPAHSENIVQFHRSFQEMVVNFFVRDDCVCNAASEHPYPGTLPESRSLVWGKPSLTLSRKQSAISRRIMVNSLEVIINKGHVSFLKGAPLLSGTRTIP